MSPLARFTRLASALVAGLLLASGAAASTNNSITGDWFAINPTTRFPGGTPIGHSALFDERRDRMIVFGAFAPTYELPLATGESWRVIASGRPPGAYACAIVDVANDRALAYGGDTHPGDLYVLPLGGDSVWTLQPTVGGPGARTFSSAVYDPARHRMILYGGQAGTAPRNDVWALRLDGSWSWSLITTVGVPPPGGSGECMIYDTANDRLVVYGGFNGGLRTLNLAGTPTWKTILMPGGARTPINRGFATAVYDPLLQRMIMFGGYAGGRLIDTWSLTLGDDPLWGQFGDPNPAPSPTDAHSAIFETPNDRMIVLGGFDADPYAWALTFAPYTPSAPRIDSIAPAIIAPGGTLKVFGSGLLPTMYALFNGMTVQPRSANDNEADFVIPTTATSGSITLFSFFGWTTSPVPYTVQPPPVLSAITPDSTRIGRRVRILGHYFTGTSRVSFHSTYPAPFSVVSDSVIDAQVDSHAASGPITVVTVTGVTSSNFDLTLLPPQWPAPIVGVSDVPNDNGGHVVVRWTHSDHDFGTLHDVTGYRIWRRAPLGLAARSRANPAAVTIDGGYWEPVGLQPAGALESYAFAATTLQDSIAGSTGWTAFFVQTLSADPTAFYASAVDSAYSIDDLAPPAPAPFTARYDGGYNALHWSASSAPDLLEYRVYRGGTLDFAPGPGSLVSASRDTSFFDRSGPWVYKLAAIDVHGNASHYSTVSPASPVASLVARLSAEATAEHTRVTWYAGSFANQPVTVYRRTEATDWAAWSDARFDGSGDLRIDDAGLAAGETRGYRLEVLDAGEHVFAGETWLTGPTPAFALERATPNPAALGALQIRFALPDGRAATLELLDVAGRRVWRREVGALGAGTHTVSLTGAGRVPPGLYLVRLSHGGETRTARVVITG